MFAADSCHSNVELANDVEYRFDAKCNRSTVWLTNAAIIECKGAMTLCVKKKSNCGSNFTLIDRVGV